MSPIFTFARIQMTTPKGAATIIALPKTKTVLSKIERTITLTILGFLYGGSSNMNDEGTPFNTVLDRTFDVMRVTVIPSRIKHVSIHPAVSVPKEDAPETKNTSIIAISPGKRPLHGTKLLVIIAIRRSLGDSIIRHPMTPQALHPNPMHMVRRLQYAKI